MLVFYAGALDVEMHDWLKNRGVPCFITDTAIGTSDMEFGSARFKHMVRDVGFGMCSCEVRVPRYVAVHAAHLHGK